VKLPRSISCTVLAVLVTATPALAAAPGCNQCKDLPKLYRELLEQEFLRNRFDRWVKEAYYPVSVSAMQEAAASQLGAAMQGGLYGPLSPAGAGGGSGGAAPSFGTDLNNRNCPLVEYVKDAQGNQKQRPVKPEDVRSRMCAPLAEFVIAHEGHHQASCRKAYGEGTNAQFGTQEFVAKDDVAAYQAGIAVLRDHIAKLARNCGWSGSTNARKPDGTMTVPTPDQVAALKNATAKQASLLKRKSK
jgi:hypothetical protein